MKEMKTLINSSVMKERNKDGWGNFWTLIIFKVGGGMVVFFMRMNTEGDQRILLQYYPFSYALCII